MVYGVGMGSVGRYKQLAWDLSGEEQKHRSSLPNLPPTVQASPKNRNDDDVHGLGNEFGASTSARSSHQFSSMSRLEYRQLQAAISGPRSMNI